MQRCAVDCIWQFVSGCMANTRCTMTAAQKQRLHMQALFLLADALSAYPLMQGFCLPMIPNTKRF